MGTINNTYVLASDSSDSCDVSFFEAVGAAPVLPRGVQPVIEIGGWEDLGAVRILGFSQ